MLLWLNLWLMSCILERRLNATWMLCESGWHLSFQVERNPAGNSQPHLKPHGHPNRKAALVITFYNLQLHLVHLTSSDTNFRKLRVQGRRSSDLLANVLKNMTLKNMAAKMQAGSSVWLAVDASIVEGSLFLFSYCLSLMILKTFMSMRTGSPGESREWWLCWTCSLRLAFLTLFSSCLKTASSLGPGTTLLARLILQRTSWYCRSRKSSAGDNSKWQMRREGKIKAT